MTNSLIKTFSLTLITLSISASLSFAQDSTQQKNCCNKEMTEVKDETHQHMDMDNNVSDKDSIVREGVIDLKTIDVNKDGKVYQDVMDWNVISDEPGKCPLCGMKLKEVSLDKAKENLIKHGFKVK